MPSSNMRRLLSIVLLVTALMVVASPVIGADSMVLATAEAETEEAEEPAPAPASDAVVPAPAVPVEPDAPDAAAPEWTFRFLMPATLLLGGLAVVGTTIAYFVKVTKARYRVVE